MRDARQEHALPTCTSWAWRPQSPEGPSGRQSAGRGGLAEHPAVAVAAGLGPDDGLSGVLSSLESVKILALDASPLGILARGTRAVTRFNIVACQCTHLPSEVS